MGCFSGSGSGFGDPFGFIGHEVGSKGREEAQRFGEVTPDSSKDMSKEEREALRKYTAILDAQDKFYRGQIDKAEATRRLLQNFTPGRQSQAVIQGLLRGEEGISQLSQATVRNLLGIRPGILETAMTKQFSRAEVTPLERATGEIGLLQAENLRRSLSGDVSLQTLQREQQEFDRFKEAMARKGVKIYGTSYADATADSTPGVQALNARRQRWQIVKDAERRGNVALGTKNLLSTTETLGGLSSARNRQLLAGAGLESEIAKRRFGQAAQFATGVPERRYGLLASTGLYGYPQAAGTFAGLAGAYPAAQQPYQYYSGLRSREDIQSAKNRTQFAGDIMGMFDFF